MCRADTSEVTRLIICEKPSVAASVAEALGGNWTRTPWGYAGDGTLVAAARGHLVAELTPDKYDERYKEWQLDHLPILPEVFRYQPRDASSATLLKQLAELMRRADVTELVNACDAGREGELIFKLIHQYARVSGKTVQRAWFASMTKDAIRAAFSNLRADRDMAGLEAAARARSEADWLVGMNATRAATLTLGGRRTQLSVGRVQTPTLALVVRRDVDIEQFVSEPYHQVRVRLAVTGGEFDSWWRCGRDEQGTDRLTDRLTDAGDAAALAARIEAAGRARIVEVDTRTEQVAPPRLFDLTDLQREANRRYGMTAARTLTAAQACYEEHKVLTYPRTDSRYLTSDMAGDVAGLVARVRAAHDAYHAACDVVSAACDAQVLINDAKVNDHHAIIPTDAAHDLSKLSVDERRIYDLVARRLLAALLPAQQLERTVVWAQVDTTTDGGTRTEWLRAAGRRELTAGWRLAWPQTTKPVAKSKSGDAEDGAGGADGGDGGRDVDGDVAGDVDGDGAGGGDALLPPIHQGEAAAVRGSDVVTRHTKAPPRLNEASLLGMMATAGRLVDDDDLADAMKDSGLGTPATRASIIERLIDVGYIERSGKQLRATDKGRGLILALGSHPLTLPDLTGSWEQRLHHMERADAADVAALSAQFGADVRRFAGEVVTGFLPMTPQLLAGFRRRLAACPMPDCDGSIVEGPRGYGCSSWASKEAPGCGFVIWKEQGGKRVTEKQLLDQVAAMHAGTLPLPGRRERVVVGTCPRCSQPVVERDKSWGCSSYRGPKDPGCGYTIWKSGPDRQPVSADELAAMLAAGTTNQREATVFANCPVCKGQIIERDKGFSCNSWRPGRKGCGTVVWKARRDGTRLSEEEVHAELARIGDENAAKTAAKRARRTGTAKNRPDSDTSDRGDGGRQ